jgi:polyisoprenyl-teichoic acid--peptidoglycan teichoic acid transferase
MIDPKEPGPNQPTPQRHLDGPMRQVRRDIFPTTRVTVPVEPSLSPAAAAPVQATVLPSSSRVVNRTNNKRRRVGWKRWFAVTAVLLVLATGLFFGAKLFFAARKIISRNTGSGAPALNGVVDPTRLRGEGDGRVNILLLGIGGPGHDGPYLSDTIMVISIDPATKDVAMLSLPRDMWVPIPGYGSAKINSACAYGESENYPGGCGALAKATVETLLDLPIHYYVQADFGAFKKAVDSVGGIDLTVDHALYDPEYPCDKNEGLVCGYSQKAGATHMNGTTALKYARCRKGNCDDDFGRALRQQKVLVALRKQALTLDTLTNPAKISGLIDSVGDHVKTDMSLPELEHLATLIKDIDTTKIISKVLDTAPDGLLVDDTSLPSRGYVELPRSGSFDDIRAFAHSIFADAYLKNEAASLEVQNGTLRAGLATSVAKMLTGYGYHVLATTTAAEQNVPKTLLYDYSGGKKPYTIQYLEKRFGVKAQSATAVQGGPDIRIIIGADYTPRASSTN